MQRGSDAGKEGVMYADKECCRETVLQRRNNVKRVMQKGSDVKSE